jgi:glycogen synthase
VPGRRGGLTPRRAPATFTRSPRGPAPPAAGFRSHPAAAAVKILIWAPAFPPSLGGTQQVTLMLAREWAALGHEVRVLTATPAAGPDRYPFRVVRRPGAPALLRAYLWCDVYHQAGLSLRGAWPLLLARRPCVVTYHMWLAPPGPLRWRDRLKVAVGRRTTGFAISRAMAAHLPFPTRVMPNPYDDEVFRPIPGVPRDRDLVFAGRLVEHKGVGVLLDALALLRGAGRHPSLTVVGDGPDAPALRARAERLGLGAQVSFAGEQAPAAVARELNRHRVLVVPSLWPEPFGIVALEGIACGCVAVGSESGGLAEAVGPCGVTVPNGDAPALAAALAELLGDEERMARHRAAAPAHLARHRRRAVAEAYLRAMDEAMRAGGRAPRVAAPPLHAPPPAARP